ncbi:hypothetical protein N7490_007060 [Penicillium lividum]|nr:hypothetical protein N7490_007060 [Penicillium lividum]
MAHFNAYNSTPGTPIELAEIPNPHKEQDLTPKTKETSSFQRHDAGGSWTWEFACAFFSVVCIGLLIGFLVYVNGMTYARWQYSISPNTVIAILAGFGKTATLVPISTCLGQFKWKPNWNKGPEQTPTQLYNFQMLDNASRGPWGSLEVLWRMPWSLPMAGALLTILSLALDPFSQQILAFPPRQVIALNKTASIQRAQEYVPWWVNSTNDLNTDFRLNQPDPMLQIALAQGLAQINNPLLPTCSTANCTFPDFTTLGFCSKCVDVTNSSTQSCTISQKGLLYCTYTSPSGLEITPGILDASTVGNWTYLTRYPWNSVTSVWDIDSSAIPQELVTILSAQYSGTIKYATTSVNFTETKPFLFECSVHFCEKQFTNVVYLPSSAQAPSPSRSQPLIPAAGYYAWEILGQPLLLLPLDGAQTFSGSNYSMDANTRNLIVEYLEGVFNATDFFSENATTYQNYVSAAVLILSNTSHTDVPKVFNSMATSMTASIRTSAQASNLQGTAYHTETYIHVRWPWISFPIILVLLSIMLLIIAALLNRDQRVLWKSSIFPLLLGRLEVENSHITQLRHLDELQSESKKIKVIVCDHDDTLSFVEVKGDRNMENDGLVDHHESEALTRTLR